jgi:DNA polymerase III subunit chi
LHAEGRDRVRRPAAGSAGGGSLRELTLTEIGFYHLTRTTLPDALARLLDRTLRSGQRALVLCPDAARVKALDTALWSVDEPAWLPHGSVADGDAELQPIWLSVTPDPANGARFLFLVDGTELPEGGDFDRVFDLFDGNDADSVAAARVRWRLAGESGHALTYWKQSPNGWEKGA